MNNGCMWKREREREWEINKQYVKRTRKITREKEREIDEVRKEICVQILGAR